MMMAPPLLISLPAANVPVCCPPPSFGLTLLASHDEASTSFGKHLCQRSVPRLFVIASHHRMLCHLSGDSGGLIPLDTSEADNAVPVPIVLIDQDADVNATVVELSFGDRLGALLDTMKALNDLGLEVIKGSASTDQNVTRTRFFITRSDTGRKVENPDLLEAIRLTIISNLLKFHPESSERLAMGGAWGIKPPQRKLDVDIATHISIVDDGSKRSLLSIETADQPGLLMDIIKTMADINVNVESAEIDTEGLVAKDKFYVNYHGAALSKSMAEVLTNCLRYHLRRPETDEDSY